MSEYLRGAWDDMVDDAEWDRFRNSSKGLGVLAKLPQAASEVLPWWAKEKVRDAFQGLAQLVLKIIAMLPTTASNGILSSLPGIHQESIGNVPEASPELAGNPRIIGNHS